MPPMAVTPHSTPAAAMFNNRTSSLPRRASGKLLLHGDFCFQIGKLDCRHGGIPSFVAPLGPGPLDRLLERIGCQHAEDDRHAGLERDTGDPRAHRVRDVFKMGSLSPDNAPETDDGVILLGKSELLGDL